MVITVAPWTQRGMTLPMDTITELWLEEQYNVELRPWYDVDSYAGQQKQVKLAAGDIPDLLGTFNVGYVEIGVVREIDQEMVRQYMPGYMKQADAYLGDEVWRRTMVDGVNYAIPSALSMASTGLLIGFRADWMEAVGVTPTQIPDREFLAGPDTIEEIEDLLLKFRNDDPDGNGKKDTYGWMPFKNSARFEESAMFPTVFGSYGVRIRTWNVVDGEPYYSMIDENYRAALKYLSTWWKKEIIHPDSVTAKRKDMIQAFVNDEFGSFSQYDSWQSNKDSTAGPWGALKAKYPDMNVAYSVTPIGPTGKRGTWYRDPNWTPWCIGINADDATTIKLMQIIEDIFTDEEKYARVFAGVEGEHFDWNADGYAVARPEVDPAKAQELGLRMILHMAHVVPPVDKVYIQPQRHALQTYIERTQVKFPAIGFRPVFGEEERALESNLRSIEDEFAWKALTGQIDVDGEWDRYVKSMMDAGLATLLDSLKNM